MIRVLFLTRYGPEAASSRQRFYNLVNSLKPSEIKCTIRPFFWNGYVAQRFASKKPPGFYFKLFMAYIKRILTLRRADDYDLIVVQAEIFPYVPAAIERIALRRPNACIYDFDDAWFHRYDENRGKLIKKVLGSKISRTMGQADAVVVGSHYLATYARRYQANLILLPTAVDLTRYPCELPAKKPGSPFTIGWIGSASTSIYLEGISGVLEDFRRAYNARIVIIGGSPKLSRVLNATYVNWAQNTEIDEISTFDVGVMPLQDTPFSRGKCAFKLIQYMACWKPVIGSPVGENSIIIEHGLNGYLADTPQAWYEALERLIKDRNLAESMGRRGRRKVEEAFSTQVIAPQFEKILKDALDSRRQAHNSPCH